MQKTGYFFCWILVSLKNDIKKGIPHDESLFPEHAQLRQTTFVQVSFVLYSLFPFLKSLFLDSLSQ